MANFGRIVTTGRRFIPQVDGLRFVAISSVVLYHVAHAVLGPGVPVTSSPGLALRAIHGGGWYGVPIFFALSGFLLALPFARAELAGGAPVKLGAYFLRRVTRLEPPYVVMLLGVFALDAAAGAPRMSLTHLAACLGYQHGSIYGAMNEMNGATWSLETEVQFYCLTPLLAPFVFRVRRAALRRVLVAVAIVAFAAVATRSRLALEPRWTFSVLGHLHEFLAGYLLADIYVHDWQEAPTSSLRWDLVSVVGWAAVPVCLVPRWRGPLWLELALPFVVLAVFCAALRGRISRWLFSRAALVVIGGACYSIYLLHGPVLRAALPLARKIVPPGPADATFVWYSALTLPLIIVACMAFFVAIERPCMDPRWPSRFRARLWRARAGTDCDGA